MNIMGVNINDWEILLSNEKVIYIVQNFKNELLKCKESISANEIDELYNTIVSNSSLSDRAKLYYLENFQNLLIKSRIRTDEGVIAYKNSLLNK